MKKMHAALLALPLMLSGTAFAADNDHSSKDSAGWHREMCLDHFAHTYGKLAYLQARLGITDKQQDAWTKWQQAETDAATKERDACLSAPPMDKAESIVDQEDHMEKMLTAKLDELHASRPALDALYAVLTDDQKKILDGVGEWHHHGRGQDMEGHDHGMDGGDKH